MSNKKESVDKNTFDFELNELLSALPPIIRERILVSENAEDLIEVVLDYGRPPEIRYINSIERLDERVVTDEDIRYVCERVSEFGGDNRAGIERTLHRISAIRNRQNRVIGLTCRVGRAIQGTIDIILDIVSSNKSILFLGKPGVGKTTKLREVARMLAVDLSKRVVIVDTSNEIAGDGDIPHPAIGTARRMQVSDPAKQHQVMIEAVENHMPEVIVIDEIGVEAEAYAARTIAERGVQLIGTAHGRTLENLMMNPTLCDLIGGIQAVTLSDEEAKRRGTQKTVLERKAPPTFDVVVELIDYNRLAIHHDVQKTVDIILRGMAPQPEIRVRTDSGEVEVIQMPSTAEPAFPKEDRTSKKKYEYVPDEAVIENFEKDKSASVVASSSEVKPLKKILRIFPYGIARTRLERAIREKRAPAVISNDASDADAVIAMRSSLMQKPNKLKDRIGRTIPTFVVKSNTLTQISHAIDEIVSGNGGFAAQNGEALDDAQREVLEAIQLVKTKGKPLELTPRNMSLRRIQHQIVESHKLRSEAIGQEPFRRVRVLP